jgi:predicted CXXCH cytochrome family protein
MSLVSDDGFNLVPRDDPVHWWADGHASQPNMQYNEWETSTHAASLDNLKASPDAKPECMTCHSSDYVFTEKLRSLVESGERAGAVPDSLTVDSAQWGVTCTTCHDPHLENTTHNDFLVDEPYALCASCHTDTDASDGLHHAMQQVYEGVTLIDNIPGIASSHFTSDNGPDCVTCHMPKVPVENTSRSSHTFMPVMPGATLTQDTIQDSCTSCHGDVVDAKQMQQLIDDIQNDTRARLERDRAAVDENAPAWVTLALDLVDGDGSFGIHNYTYTDELLDAVEVELGIAEVAEAQP